jgi:hypothetical protein
MSDPTIAFASPPPSDPAAGVLWVKKFPLRAAKPLENRMNKIHKSTTIPRVIAIIERVNPILFVRFLLL